MKLERLVLMLMRVSILFQVVVGLALWEGFWMPLRNAHTYVGLLFVALLFILGGMGLAKGPNRGLGAVAVLWAAAIAWLGIEQMALLPGELHWIVRLAHLAISVAAMPFAEKLGKSAP